MPKLPFMKFYPSDFLIDAQRLTMQEKGMWISLLCHIWIHSENGTVEMDESELSQIIGTRTEDLVAFKHLIKTEVGDIKDIRQEGTILCRYRIHSRRIERDKKDLKMNAFYVSKHRSKGLSKENVMDKKSEAKKSEVIKDKDLPPNPLKGGDIHFEEFWRAYPKRVAKGAALKAWAKLCPDDALRSSILKAVFDQRKSSQWMQEGGKYIPYPASWLNGRRWDDEFKPGRDNRPSSILDKVMGRQNEPVRKEPQMGGLPDL